MKTKSFYSKVYEIVSQIPRGKVATYKEIARLAGSPRASRAVGSAMKNNPDLNKIPCHRVVGSDGKMHGYSAGHGVTTKIKMLHEEGVAMNGGRVQLNISAWKR